MHNIEIYYFSGTGNSLHVAKELQKRIPEIKLIPIIASLDNVITTNAQTVGFVFPTYLTSVPAPIRKFINQLDLKSSTYTFSIVTRIGTFCTANTFTKKALEKQGKTLDASFMINMANNSPTGLRPIADKKWINKIEKEKIDDLECKVQKKLDLIKDCIINKEKRHKEGVSVFHYYFLEPIMSSLTKNIKNEIPFYADYNCNGCGICEKVCLSKKVKMVEHKPAWSTAVQCYYCYACFNFCPIQSVLVKGLYTEKSGRYVHPEISAKNIEEQKR